MRKAQAKAANIILTTVQAATFEVTSSVGKFKVNCGLVFSPNIKKPQTAAPRYEKKATLKLHQYEPTQVKS